MQLEAVVGPEFVTGSTRMKAGTAQKLMLNMISTAVMIRLGRVEGNKMVNMQLTNNKLGRTRHAHDRAGDGFAEAEARALLARLRLGQGRARQGSQRRPLTRGAGRPAAQTISPLPHRAAGVFFVQGPLSAAGGESCTGRLSRLQSAASGGGRTGSAQRCRTGTYLEAKGKKHRKPPRTKRRRPSACAEDRRKSVYPPGLTPSLLGFDTLGGVRHLHQPFFGDEAARGLADAVGFVLDAHERHFEVADELHLMCGQPPALLLREGRSTLLEHLERRRGVLRIVVGRMGDRRTQQS